ncbi:uncharacterized protein [Linepithema humile]|uniref:uncharacterized protein n=1 Tax=Linepithema humile TaxID=83485 RepID=UPI0006231376|nr:PREDICTED: uncharacterized protein LOC105671292 [Linepithema humile]
MFSTVQQTTVSNLTNKQQGVETFTKKRKYSPNENGSNSPSIDRSMITPPRILVRRYPLTKTGYKYLDIGINVSTPSRVEIALGDNHGKELRLSYGVWKELMNQQGIIANFFKNDVDEAPSQTVGHCTLSFGKINNLKVMRLATSALCLIMSSQTAYNMFALEYCVDCINHSLNNVTGIVDVKFAHFSEIARNGKDPDHVASRKSDLFDKNNIIDCELVTQVFAEL